MKPGGQFLELLLMLLGGPLLLPLLLPLLVVDGGQRVRRRGPAVPAALTGLLSNVNGFKVQTRRK